MTIFQRLYDWIKGLTTPEWLKDFLEYITRYILYPALLQLGEDAKDLLQKLIIQASKLPLDNEDKFNWVLKEFKDRWGGGDIKDHIINLSIEILVGVLKRKGLI